VLKSQEAGVDESSSVLAQGERLEIAAVPEQMIRFDFGANRHAEVCS
jgi:hypothetical protein